MHDREVQDIKADLLDMKAAFRNRGIDPHICTLPPLLNRLDDVRAMQKLNEVNAWLIKQKHWKVIDLHDVFVRSDEVIKSFYQP